MWELFWLAFAFSIGSYVGQNRATNVDITDRTNYMQSLIDRAYAERDNIKKDLDFANIRIDMWEERYWNLLNQLENEEEDGLGSSDDGSHEGSERPNQLQEN